MSEEKIKVDDSAYEQEYAERYAVASIIYYTSPGKCAGMNDAQFDGFARWLLKHRSWKRIPWLEKGLLIAGTGYDVKKFPRYLHERATEKLMKPCPCIYCMLARGEIKDPDTIERLEGKKRGSKEEAQTQVQGCKH